MYKWIIDEDSEVVYLMSGGTIIRTVFVSEEDEGYYYNGKFFTDFNKVKERIAAELGMKV